MSRLGPESTSPDWQRHAGDVCVWPVGALEQHDAHLPLATDAILAEFFARALADDLGAALLPTLPIGTSFEHTGFRGSVSFRPETVGAIVRDIADELERQSFRVLVLVNGHGGNFAFAPVARDVNRRDRGIKLVLVDWWEHAPGSVAEDSAALGAEVHAGELETSVMLAVRPDLVGERVDTYAPPKGEPEPLVRRDLNTFGVGHFNPTGAIGFPSFASAAKGRALIDAARPRIAAHVRDRIRRLRDEPRYAGAGGIAVRAMGEADLGDGLRLVAGAGWNQLAADWRAFLAGGDDACCVAVRDGRVLGSAATIRYGAGADAVAWVSMVLVDPAERGAGLGTRLLDAALARLSDVACVKLDATPAGRPLYLKRGFVDEQRFTRWGRAASGVAARAHGDAVIDAPRGDDAHAIAALDRAVSGLERARVLALARTSPAARVLRRGGAVRGFALARPGRLATHLGPVVAESLDDAEALIRSALTDAGAASIDAADAQPGFAERLAALGFAPQRPLIRMRRGAAGPPGDPQRAFAICGPEFG